MKRDIFFDETTHTYLVDGKEVPSVTEILQPLHRAYANVNPSVLEYARNRGTAVHEALEQIDLDGNPDISPEILPYIRAYEEWCSIYKPTWIGVEQIVYNSRDEYIGTLDRIGYFNGDNEVLNIVDLKTSQPTKDALVSVCLQTYAYDMAYRVQNNYWKNGDPKSKYHEIKTWGLFLKPDGTFRFVDCDAYDDKYTLGVCCAWNELLNIHMTIDHLLATGKGKG
jgi:hypothetical protein